MNEHDETRVPPPVPPTLSQAPDAPTPTFLPGNATAAQTPDQISSLLAASDRDPPPVVPGYEILSKLGAGGMGVVYRARELAFDRDVAVKVLKAKYPAHSPVLRRFLEESRITAQLQHPAIPPVHHIGELADGRPFLAMKLIKGDTLADLLAAEGVVRSRFMPAFAQVCHAVAYAHSRKVIHRDLKPQNVMVGAFGEVQVMDWGLAKVLGGASEPEPAEPGAEVSTEIRAGRDPDSETQAGSVMGTPAYMAPEQAAGEVERIDERADVFGLGAMLCALLTGDPPYTGSGKDSVRVKAIRCDTTDAFARLDASGADPELIALCKRCLSREPDARPRDAGQVAKEVAAHLAAVEERARQAELERARAEERRKKRRVQWALAVAGTFAAVITNLWYVAESQRGIAVVQRDVADKAKDDADKAREREELAHSEVERERAKLAVFEYGRTMQLAHQEWRDGNLLTVRALLRSTNPKLRGWEWHYLHQLQDPSLFTLKGHTATVYGASFSADGTRLITMSGDKTVKVWDASTGTELLTLEGRTGRAGASADGTRIVSGGDGNAKVFDAKTGAELLTLKCHKGARVASFSPDGNRIVIVSDRGDATASVWDAHTGTELLVLKHEGGIASASFSPDGTHILTAGSDNTARVWDANTGTEVLTLKGHTRNVYAASFSADGTRIVTASADATAKVWTMRPNKSEGTTKPGAELLTLKGHRGLVFSAMFSPDGTHIVTGSWDETAKVWDARTGAEVRTLKGHTGHVNEASFSTDGTRILTASADRTAKVWDARTVVEPALSANGFYPTAAAFSPDGNRFVTGHDDGTVRVWNAKTGVELLTLKEAELQDRNCVKAVSFSPDGTRIFIGVGDFTTLSHVVVRDSKTGAALRCLENLGGTLEALSLSLDGTRIVTAGDNLSRFKEVVFLGPRPPFQGQVWDARTGAKLFALKGHAGGLYAASFSADGTRIVTGSNDKTARIWDGKTGTELLTLRGHAGGVYSASFSADGTRIVTGSGDTTAKVWDAKTGVVVHTLKGHTGTIRAALFSADGTRIVTEGTDKTARLWDVQTGAEVFTMKGDASLITVASFSSDGTRVVADNSDGKVKVWPASLSPLVAPAPRPKP